MKISSIPCPKFEKFGIKQCLSQKFYFWDGINFSNFRECSFFLEKRGLWFLLKKFLARKKRRFIKIKDFTKQTVNPVPKSEKFWI